MRWQEKKIVLLTILYEKKILLKFSYEKKNLAQTEKGNAPPQNVMTSPLNPECIGLDMVSQPN